MIFFQIKVVYLVNSLTIFTSLMNKLLLLRSEIVVVVAQSSPGTDKETSTFMVDMCYSLLATSQKFEVNIHMQFYTGVRN